MKYPQMTSQEEFKLKGYFLKENFISQQECKDILQLISDYRQKFLIPKEGHITGITITTRSQLFCI